ncbi:MAG: hypothetical protein ACQETQ_13750, partial [Spirochaetota bacterium]
FAVYRLLSAHGAGDTLSGSAVGAAEPGTSGTAASRAAGGAASGAEDAVVPLPLPGVEFWHQFLDRALEIQELKRDRVYESRKKDYDNPFRFLTYRNEAEMKAAIGDIEDNRFVKQVREETETFRVRVERLRSRG